LTVGDVDNTPDRMDKKRKEIATKSMVRRRRWILGLERLAVIYVNSTKPKIKGRTYHITDGLEVRPW
jgi:hypothetical protein